jgi:hypothetical protein
MSFHLSFQRLYVFPFSRGFEGQVLIIAHVFIPPWCEPHVVSIGVWGTHSLQQTDEPSYLAAGGKNTAEGVSNSTSAKVVLTVTL